MASNYNEDWQSSKKTVLQRNAYMFNKGLLSDVSFTCGKSSRKIHAHKYVLASSSVVFMTMFCGSLPQQESTICIENVEEKSLEEFLRFLYTDDCNITIGNVIEIMYLAIMYLIKPLEEKCSKFIEESIKPDNAFILLEQAVLFDKKELEVKCWDCISKKTRECINSEQFCNISSGTLNVLLEKTTLIVQEMELFKAVLKWVDSECARRGLDIEADKNARRNVLGDSVYNIQFLAMSEEDFEQYVSPVGILTDAEIKGIRQKLEGRDLPDLKWKDNREKWRSTIIHFNRFDSAKIMDEIWKDYHGNAHDALTLTVNKKVLFHGVRLFGDSNSSQYQVHFTIQSEEVFGTYISEQDSDDGVSGYDVMLPKPIPLLPCQDITLTATIKGPASHRGWDGRPSVEVNDIVVTFKKATAGSGRIHKIFLSRL